MPKCSNSAGLRLSSEVCIVNKQGSHIQRSIVFVCECGETLHVDSIHTKGCLSYLDVLLSW